MVTYFIESKGLIKVGKTTDIHRRLKQYRLHNPYVKLLYVHDGDIEKKIHKLLADYKVQGEWFDLPKYLVEDVIHFLSVCSSMDSISPLSLSRDILDIIRRDGTISRVIVGANRYADFEYSLPLKVLYVE